MSPRKTSGWGKPAKTGFTFKDRSGRVHGRGPSAFEGEPGSAAPKSAKGKVITGKPGKPSPNKPKFGKSQGKFPGKSARKDDRSPDRAKGHFKDRGSPRKDGFGPGEVRTLKATVDKNRKGFGFLLFEDRKLEDAFVPPREAENLFHGDRVEATVDRQGNISSIRVLQHRFREVVGRFIPHPMGATRGGWVVYERKRAREEIFIPELKQKVEANDWLRAKLTFHDKGPHPVTAEVIDVYGQVLPPSADVGMIAAEYNLVEEHSAAAEKEARSFSLPDHFKDREDFRDVPFITIDGETARDFDDAVYVERAGEGFVLWVAIADVSHYVTPGTALDEDSRSRGTSVYFPERAFHMLPRALSESLCSLRPKEARLTLVAKMQYDSQGVRKSTELFEAVIESKRRATYNEIQAEMESNRGNAKWEYRAHFDLYELIRKTRAARGSIDFDLAEAEVLVKPTGEVISIKQRTRIEAHRLIEEFMISANEAVTEWMLERKWPFIYRVHDEPSAQSLLKFQTLAATVGVRVRLDEQVAPKILADIVKTLEGHPAQALLNQALLRSMKQAVYSSVHGIHYGLASEAYTHFTSPIRRYPDLIVHRLLRRALRIEQDKAPKLGAKERDDLEKELLEIAEHCSYRERLASDAERESNKLKQVRLMLDHLGDEYDGKVIGMAEMGLFVEVRDPFVEGMIVKEAMTDDAYEFNEERMVFYGRRKKRTFKIGDPIRVKVLRSDLDRRQIEFGLL